VDGCGYLGAEEAQRSSRATWAGLHLSARRGVRMPCAFKPAAMACRLVVPPSRSASMTGMTSLARAAAGAPGCGRRLQALLGRPHAAVASQLLAARLGGGQRLLHAPRDEAARHPVADLPVAGQVVCDPPQEPRACRRRLSSGRGRARRASRPALALTERRNAGDDRRCGTRRAGLRGAWVCWIFAVWVTCWAFPLTGG